MRKGAGEGLAQVVAQLLVEEVYLVERGDRRALGEACGVELGEEGPLRPFGVFARVEDEGEQPGAGYVAQEAVA